MIDELLRFIYEKRKTDELRIEVSKFKSEAFPHDFRKRKHQIEAKRV